MAKRKAEKKVKAPKAIRKGGIDLDAGEASLRSKLSGSVKLERKVADLEKARNDQRVLLTEANKAYEKGVLQLREAIAGAPQGDLFPDGEKGDDEGSGEESFAA